MHTNENTLRQEILRALIVTASGILVGFALYGNAVFVSTLMPSQFTVCSGTAGIVYTTLKSKKRRKEWAMLIVWYAIYTGQQSMYNSSVLIRSLTCIAGMTFAVLVYNRIVIRPFANRMVLRPIFAAAIVALVNGLLAIALEFIAYMVYHVPFKIQLDTVMSNAHMGAIIGFAIGIGIEIAEYLIRKMHEYKGEVVTEDSTQHKIE